MWCFVINIWLISAMQTYFASVFSVFHKLLLPLALPMLFNTSIAVKKQKQKKNNTYIHTSENKELWVSKTCLNKILTRLQCVIVRPHKNNCFQPCFLSFLSTRSWFKRSFSLLNSLSFLLISWLYWLARLAIMLWSLCTWQSETKKHIF